MTALLELATCPGLPFIDSIIAGLPAISARGSNTSIGEIDLSPVIEVLSKSPSTFAYTGSLTQPPCTEGVKWVIPQHTFPITVHQFNALKSVCKFNSRYTQNKLGDGNLLQIAKGNDTDPAETKQQESQVKRRAKK
jgi:carbonic anhydrase